MLILLLQETPAICYNDQVLGVWEVNLTEYNVTPTGDLFSCPRKVYDMVASTKHITLMSPNRAIDSDGFTGTWTMNFAYEMEIKIGGFVYFWQLGCVAVDDERELSMCNKSKTLNAWSYEDGLTRGKFACVKATNIKPLLSEVTNLHWKGVPPVIHYYDLDSDASGASVALPQQPQQAVRKSGLPDVFDWRDVNGTNYVPEALNIYRCSAWGAVMFAQMMESRIRIASNDTVKPHISAQHLVDCNVFQQGCMSGHPEDHAKFAYQFGLLDEREYGKTFYPDDFNETCMTATYLDGKRYFVDSYQFMGGYYGAQVTLNEMKEEIYKHGPIIASVQQNGIFGTDPYGQTREYYEYEWDTPARHFYFDLVKSYVLIVGWTKLPSGTDAWIIQNAFGKDWNGDGTALVAMGFNAYAIESAPFVAYWRPGSAVSYEVESFATVNLLVGFLVLVLAIAMIIAALLAYVPRGEYTKIPVE